MKKLKAFFKLNYEPRVYIYNFLKYGLFVEILFLHIAFLLAKSYFDICKIAITLVFAMLISYFLSKDVQ